MLGGKGKGAPGLYDGCRGNPMAGLGIGGRGRAATAGTSTALSPGPGLSREVGAGTGKKLVISGAGAMIPAGRESGDSAGKAAAGCGVTASSVGGGPGVGSMGR